MSHFRLYSKLYLMGFDNGRIGGGVVTNEEMLKRLESFKLLKKDWDSYGAEPIRGESIELAKLMIHGFPKDYIWGVYPGTDEDVEFETFDGQTISVFSPSIEDK